MKRSLVILFVLALILSTMVVFAFEPKTPAENDPAINFDANACFIGGAWEGKCGDSDLMWNAGWYLLRLNQGIISSDQVPDQYKWIIVKDGQSGNEIEPTPTGKPPCAAPVTAIAC